MLRGYGMVINLTGAIAGSLRDYEPLIADDIAAPLGKSPDKIRRRQKDWQVGSGRGLRR